VENNGLLKNIRDSLNDYEDKLQDLRSILQEAAAQAKQATGINHENEGVLGAIQVSHGQELPALINDWDEGKQERDQVPVELFYRRP
jgi:laminin alpha 3/5